MTDKLRCMTSVFLLAGDKLLMLYRKGGRVINNLWVGSAGGHFEQNELNDPRACVLRELNEELGLTEGDLSGLALRYIVFKRTEAEIRHNYYFFAELKGGERELISTEGECRWIELARIGELKMPTSVRSALLHYQSCGKFTDEIHIGIVNGDDASMQLLPITE